MRLTLITLTGTGHPPPHGLQAPLLVDLLWAAATPADRVEHVSARAGPGHIDLGVYTRAPYGESARAAVAVVRRALALNSSLRGWALTRVRE
ncbi:hypothetical protein [Streptomyces sp. MST-110588]|uniref:hypothetical protein n=1 Tax=Streptomyces sp. MST-110588 TaxID=2833628 RepID=UPI001F5C9A93|nr:hypothetical protein [Streptomyces sp. MST-110588]UNO41650.1 hypothetical protein KGS77_21500 [Streptomyces sp. MST-110588]